MLKQWNPSSWVIFKVKNHETPHYRLLCGWNEGYEAAKAKTEWKISGGILESKESEDGLSWIFTTTKSEYVCDKSSYQVENHVYHVWQTMIDDPDKDVEQIAYRDLQVEKMEWLKL
jgi:hypothetical protein